MTVTPARLDSTPVDLEVGDTGLRVGGDELAWTELDHFEVDGHAVHLVMADGRRLTVTHLATQLDRFVREATEARARARRAALLQWTGGPPTADFAGKRGDVRVTVTLFPDGVTVEPVNGIPDFVPLSCLRDVHRDGYDLTFATRGLPPVGVRHLGQRTEEFLAKLDRARTDLAARTAAAYAALDPALAGLDAADGWAVTAADAGHRWAPLRGAVARHSRAAEVALLEELAGADLRLGLKLGPGSDVMPFALAPTGGRVAVEATDTDARATFVFATDDADRLNAVLLLTSFRREALWMPLERLGRWALAERTLEVVRWARAALVARVVHDSRWEAGVRAALA
jgi:hypothetical protein